MIFWRSVCGVSTAILLLLSAAGVAGQTLSAPPVDSTPAANPSRPTVTNPATLPPVGYLQFENGYLGSFKSPDTAAQHGINQVTKVAVHSRVMLQAQFQPWATTRDAGTTNFYNGFGDVLVGAQIVLFTPDRGSSATSGSSDPTTQSAAKTPVPTIAIGYLRRVHSGTTGDTDQGSLTNSFVLLFSGDLGGFHYDTNYLVNTQPGTSLGGAPGGCTVSGGVITCPLSTQHNVTRAQYVQTLSVNHAVLNPNFQISVELYHFTQPFVSNTDNQYATSRANAVDLLFAPSYQVRPNLIIDAGFSSGITNTSTRWQAFAGFTYLLPKRLWPEHKS